MVVQCLRERQKIGSNRRGDQAEEPGPVVRGVAVEDPGEEHQEDRERDDVQQHQRRLEVEDVDRPFRRILGPLEHSLVLAGVALVRLLNPPLLTLLEHHARRAELR